MQASGSFLLSNDLLLMKVLSLLIKAVQYFIHPCIKQAQSAKKNMSSPLHNNKLLNRSYKRTLVSTVLTAIAPLVATLVDGLFASHMLGAEAFNAVNLVIPIVNGVSILTMICNIGGSVLAASQLAKGDIQKANRIFTISLVSSVMVALVATAAIGLFKSDITAMFAVNERDSMYINEYLGVLLGYFVLVPFCTTLNNFVAVEGNPQLTTRAVATANIVNVLLDIVFIGLLHWGIRGAAFATVISGVVNFAMFIPHFARHRSKYRLVMPGADKWQLLRENLKHGFGFNVFYIATNVFMIMCNSLISDTLGIDALTLFGVCLQIQSFTFAFTIGICFTGVSLISYLRGEGDHESVLHILNKTLRHAALFYGALAILMAAMPRIFLMIFSLDHEPLISMARLPFFCYGIYYLCFCIQAIYVTLSFQLSGHVGAKILFVFGMCTASYIMMHLLSTVSPNLLWYGLAAGSIPFLMLSIGFGYWLHRRNPMLSRFTVSAAFPEYIQVDFSLSTSLADNEEIAKSADLFSDICEMPERTKQDIMQTFKKLVQIVTERRGKSERTFDVFIRERDDKFELVVKDDGSPFDPTASLTHSEIERNVDYRFVFGMNITSVSWHK